MSIMNPVPLVLVIAVLTAPAFGQQTATPVPKPSTAASMPMDCGKAETMHGNSKTMGGCGPSNAASASASKTKSKRHDHTATKNN